MKNSPFSFKKGSHRNILIITLAILLIISTVSAFVIADRNKLDKSGNLNVSYGMSQLPEELQNKKVLFQVHQTGVLGQSGAELEFAFVGEATKVVMTAPDGETDEQEIPKEFVEVTPTEPDVSIGQSGELGLSGQENPKPEETLDGGFLRSSENNVKEDTVTEEVFSVKKKPTVAAVFSNLDTEEKEKVEIISTNDDAGYTEDTIAQIDDTLILETKSKVDFPVAETGEYLFDLYNAEGTWIARTGIKPRGMGTGDLTIDISPGKEFSILETTNEFIVTYESKGQGVKERILIYVPPYFNLMNYPTNESDLEFKKLVGQEFPVEFYENDPNAAILLDFYKNNSGAKSQFTSDVLQIDLSENYDRTVYFRFSISPPNSSVKYRSLSDLMIAYGKKPDEIPLRVHATAYDVTSGGNGVELAADEYVGHTKLIDSKGVSQEKGLTFPREDLTNRYEVYFGYPSRPRCGTYSSSYYNVITTWPQYPYTDVYFYSPYIEGAEPYKNISTAEIVEIDGQKYEKYPATSSQQGYFNAYKNYNYALQNFNEAGYFYLPHLDTLRPGDKFPSRSSYMSYTFKGESYMQKLSSTAEITVPSYISTIGGYSSTPSIHYQGSTEDTYTVTLSNSSTSYTYTPILETSKLWAGTYEDAVYTIEYPYEISPKTITYTNGKNSYNDNRDVLPTKITYTTYSGKTGEITVPTSGYTITMPEDDIKEVKFYYDAIYSHSSMSYKATATNRSVDIDGNQLPKTKRVYVKTNLSTESGKVTGGYLRPESERVYVDMTPSSYSYTAYYDLLRVPEIEDGLRFGTFRYSTSEAYENQAHVLKGTNVADANRGLTYYPNNKYYSSPWTFGFKTITDATKDYEDVVVTIEPQTINDKKAFSKITGFYAGYNTRGSYQFVEKMELRYWTNLTGDTYKTLNILSSSTNRLSLEVGEYPVKMELHLGTISGSALKQHVPNYDVGNTIRATSYYDQFGLQFNQTPYYFENTPEQERIKGVEEYKITAKASTSSVAKYIDEPSTDPTAEFKNNLAVVSIHFRSYDEHLIWDTTKTIKNWKVYDSNSDSFNTILDSKGVVFYQGTNFGFTINEYISASVNPNDSTSYQGSSKQNQHFPSQFVNYDHRLYIEMYDDFELTSVDGYETEDIKPITADGTVLYTFKPILAEHTKLPETLNVWGYVRSDATTEAETINVVKRIGVDYEPFIQASLKPDETSTGSDDYYYIKDPYIRVLEWKKTKSLPSVWEIDDSKKDHTTYYNENLNNNTVNVDWVKSDRVVMNPVISGQTFIEEGIFRDFQKKELNVDATITNPQPSMITTHKTIYTLPRKGVDTVGALVDGVNKMHSNNFSMYLTGPVEFTGKKPTHANPVVYYNSAGTAIQPNGTTVPWSSVATVEVNLEDLTMADVYIVRLPVTTDYEKIGKEVQDIASHIGAHSEITVSGQGLKKVYSDPGRFVFRSYTIDLLIGLDSKEDGSRYSNLSGAAKVEAFYKDGTGTSSIYSETFGYKHSININADASHIKITPLDTTKYKLTKEKSGVSDVVDSDIPRDTGVKNIELAHLTEQQQNQFDANLVKVHTTKNLDITVRVGETKTLTPSVVYVDGAHRLTLRLYHITQDKCLRQQTQV